MDADIKSFSLGIPLVFKLRTKDLRQEYFDYLGKPESMECHHLIAVMANYKCLADITAESTQRSLRTEIVCKLKLSGLWHEPWISLVNRELPGADDSEAVLAETGQTLATVSADMLSFLSASDYDIDHSAAETIYKLSLSILLSSKREKHLLRVKLFREAEDIIRQHHNLYPHPGWIKILDKYFPRKRAA